MRSTRTRYPVKVQRFARTLYDDGRTVPEVQAALAKQGYRPARSTVTYWCRDDQREVHNLKAKMRLYPNGRQRQVETVWWAKRRRMRQLRDAGLSYSSIAKVMNLDYGTDLDGERTRYLLNQSRRPEFVLARASEGVAA